MLTGEAHEKFVESILWKIRATGLPLQLGPHIANATYLCLFSRYRFQCQVYFIPDSDEKLRSTRSNPVPAREEWDPIHAEESLTAAFMSTTVSGQWILRLRDTTAKELSTGIGKAANRHAHGDGGVAGWEVSARMRDSCWGLWGFNLEKQIET